MDKKLWPYIKQARGWLVLTVGCALLAATLTVVQMLLLSQIVSRVFLARQLLEQVSGLLGLLLAVLVARGAFIWGREVAAQQGAIRVKALLRSRLFMHLLRLGPAFSRGERTGELVTTMSEGIERLDAYVSRYLPQTVLSVLIPLLILLVVITLDSTSALLLLLTGPIIPLLMILVGSYAEKHMRRQWLALSHMSAHFLDVVQGLTTLKLFRRSQDEHERIKRISDDFRKRTLRVLRIAFLSGAVLEFMSTVAIGLIAVVLGIRLLNQGISFEHAFLVLLLTPEFFRPLRDLGVHRHAGLEGKVAAQRIVEILETAPPVRDAAATELRPQPALTIALSGVSYSYAGSEQPALNDITLTLPAGVCTALVGRSGAGKSTLANLLLRFIDANSGTITVNGIPLTSLPVEEWRSSIALVPQQPYLFYGSVRENIRLARPDASDDEVERAAGQAGALTFIEQLPQGFDTPLGERGLRLSAGQAQRLALARAFLKNAPLLILDEPTSSLDPESETLIRQSLQRLMRDRTVLVIAHRLNTIAQAGQIAVLEQGRLVEVGPPEELLKRNGFFARLAGVRWQEEQAVL